MYLQRYKNRATLQNPLSIFHKPRLRRAGRCGGRPFVPVTASLLAEKKEERAFRGALFNISKGKEPKRH